MEIYDVVIKLIGQIDPVGETRADEERYKNLVAMTKLVDRLLSDIDDVAHYNKDRAEFSMKKAGQFANSFQTRMGIVP